MDRIVRTVLVAALLGEAAFAAPDLMFGSGEFDLETSWSGPNTTFAMDPEDYGRCDDLSDSGTGELVSVLKEGELRTCVLGITPSTSYSFDGRLFFPAGQLSTGEASLYVSWKSSKLNCEGSSTGLDSGSAQPSSVSGVWVRHGMLDLVSPPGTFTARVGVLIEQATGAQPLTLKVDGFHLQTGHGFLFHDGFELGSSCRWSSDAG